MFATSKVNPNLAFTHVQDCPMVFGHMIDLEVCATLGDFCNEKGMVGSFLYPCFFSANFDQCVLGRRIPLLRILSLESDTMLLGHGFDDHSATANVLKT